jgi:hypothetical protein
MMVEWELPDAKGAKVAQKTQKREIQKRKMDWMLQKKCDGFVLILRVFFASFAQLLRPLRPVLVFAFQEEQEISIVEAQSGGKVA